MNSISVQQSHTIIIMLLHSLASFSHLKY